MTYFSRFRDASGARGALVWSPVDTAPRGVLGRLPLGRRVPLLGRWIAMCIKVMADHYAAAATYEQLSRLSDAELQRRGLSRENLAREVLSARDRAEHSD